MQLGLSGTGPVVLYSGSFEAYQGLPELIAAIPAVRARVPDVTFVLVGADRANGLVAHENAGGLVTAGALRIVDRQPRAAMASYLALADVLVSPRAYGGNLPLKVFDYLAAGRPIVATDIPTHRTVLADDRAVLVAPAPRRWPKESSPCLRRSRACAASGCGRPPLCPGHFGWSRFVDSVEALYAEVERDAVVGRA